jgi:putative membrane protein
MIMLLHGPYIGGWALGSLMFWVLVAVAIVVLVRLLSRGQQPQPPHQGFPGGTRPYPQPGTPRGHTTSAAQILAERFARGEIDEDEFHQRMAVLRSEETYPGTDGTAS